MLTVNQNRRLTSTSRGTPMGKLLRAYWHPVALERELEVNRPLPLTVLGEELVLFKDESGNVGLLDRHCSHRLTDLSYGRVEDGGLRCIYHGWLYDVNGRCLQQPGEPPNSSFHEKIRHPAYPCRVAGGMVLAYLGSDPVPAFPPLEALHAPRGHVYTRKYLQECNFIQGNEGNIDPVHGSYLHRSLAEDPNDWRRVRVPGSRVTAQSLRGRDTAPEIEIAETGFGVRIMTTRRVGEGKKFVRISNFVLPNLSVVPGATEGDGYNINWHVPIDDTRHWKFQVTFRRSSPLDLDRLEADENALVDEGFRLRRNRDNRYQQDRDEMTDRWYSGLGSHFIVHDTLATETQGPVEDRTREHLGTTDKAIAASRVQLFQALRQMEQGIEPPNRAPEGDPHPLEQLVVRSQIFNEDDDPWRAWGLQREGATASS